MNELERGAVAAELRVGARKEEDEALLVADELVGREKLDDDVPDRDADGDEAADRVNAEGDEDRVPDVPDRLNADELPRLAVEAVLPRADVGRVNELLPLPDVDV